MEDVSKIIRLDRYKLITEYIKLNFSHFCDEFGMIMYNEGIVEDIAKFNYIIGRMENYLSDKKDFENFELMENWFMKELDERNYVLSDYLEFVNNKLHTEEE